ncbi:VanZ family protein [Inhella gelatinilytica]|uniref:VanZ family protein n=1 Tax=Inhella gelatinilytica TaxID=2795030 RepID=A0A931IYF4_9BURK|nr:VanZ family protein [Inhella gelatinilytica]MBH9553901.1 VanZ family protein [Inhella gelatinilytica]
MRISSLAWLALVYAASVAYASLYPFSPWERPGGMPWGDLLRLPWPRYWSVFDVWANALGYLPLGFLIAAAAWRHQRSLGWCALFGGLLPAGLAFTLEAAQYGLPARVPSLADWALNSGGASVGAGLAVLCARVGWLGRWVHWREVFFQPGSAWGLTLLALWPLGLLFPPPLPLAQGQWLPGAVQQLREWGGDAGWVAMLPELTGQQPGTGLASLLTALGLLGPCLVMLACAKPGGHRLFLVLALLGLGVGMSGVSAALNFGPAHTWSWQTPGTGWALAWATLGASLAAAAPARVAAVLVVPTLTALLVLINGVAQDAYWLRSLAQWQAGPRVHLIGLFQWIGWLWPVAALMWALGRLLPEDQGNP